MTVLLRSSQFSCRQRLLCRSVVETREAAVGGRAGQGRARERYLCHGGQRGNVTERPSLWSSFSVMIQPRHKHECAVCLIVYVHVNHASFLCLSIDTSLASFDSGMS